jgi:hypothetical protein
MVDAKGRSILYLMVYFTYDFNGYGGQCGGLEMQGVVKVVLLCPLCDYFHPFLVVNACQFISYLGGKCGRW